MTLPGISTPAKFRKNWIIWIGSGLIIGGLAFWMMKKVANDPYFLLNDQKEENTHK